MADFLLKYWAAALSNPTDGEAALEPHIAALGVRYRCQHPLWGVKAYRLDFALLDEKIAIEVDDPSHTQKRKRAADKMRTARLNKAGWKVLRTTNEAVLADPAKALADCFKSAGINPSTFRKV